MNILIRNLLKTPLFTSVAILSLALGIGANTAIFSMLDRLLFRTLQVKDPHELVFLYSEGPWQGSMSSDEAGGPSFSYPLIRELQKAQTPFTGIGAAASQLVSLSYKNDASHGQARLVSGNYFDLLGVRAGMGRLLTEDDDRTPGAHPLAVLSHHYWTERFAADPSVLNQTILVNSYPMTVVGVTQEAFGSDRQGFTPEVFLPLSMADTVIPDQKSYADRKQAWIGMFARRKPGVSLEQAQVQINASYRPQLQIDIDNLRNPQPDFLKRFQARTITLKPGDFGRGGLRERTRPTLLLLMGITGLVLLIACANVANLQLGRSAARGKEVAVRLALGASRAQLIRQFLAESCVLAVVGGALGLLVALGTVRILLAMPATRGLEQSLNAALDGRVVLFSLALSVFTGLLFGLFSALQATKTGVVASLKDQAGQISSARSANVFRKTLVTAQVGISLLLLVCAGLFGKTLVNLARVDLGLRADHLITFNLLPKVNRYSDQRVEQLHRDLLERLAAIPGVQSVSSARVPALANSTSSSSFVVEGAVIPSEGDGSSAAFNNVGPGYFRTMGIPLVAGREFTTGDKAGSPKVAIVNEAFVKKFVPKGSPLGLRVAQTSRALATPDTEIVGVVKDTRYSNAKNDMQPIYYFPLAQVQRWGSLNFYLRTSIPPQNAGPQIRREVAAIDPGLPIRNLKTLEAQIEENTANERSLLTLTGAFAGLATLLAAIGLYGVLAYNISRRTREIGIRIALGASAARVRGLVAREVALMLAIGSAVGLGAAAAGGKVVQSYLFEMKPWDAAVYLSAALLLWVVAIAAAYVPSRRATGVDPMVALRYE